MGGTHICKTCGRLDRTLHVDPISHLCYYYCRYGGRIDVRYLYEVDSGFRCAHWTAIE